MPSRIIREGIIESEIINSLSEHAELFYRRLMSIVDDFGRFEARPAVLRTRLFGLQLERWPISRVTAALDELSRIPVSGSSRIPLLLVYEVDSRKYLEIQNFKQRVRASGSRYPAPTVRQLVASCPTDDGQVTGGCSPSACATTPSPNTNTDSVIKKIPEKAVVILDAPKISAVSSVAPGLDEFREKWAKGTQSTVGLTALDSLWVALVAPGDEAKVFACLDSYLASRQVADGVVHKAENWFMEQYRTGWTNRWTPVRIREPPKKESREAKMNRVFGDTDGNAEVPTA